MLATNTNFIPLLKTGEYIILNEHLEHAMAPEQLDRIIEKHNKGMDISLIAEQERRHPAEIFLALIHQATVSFKSEYRSKVSIQRPVARLI